MADVRNCRRCGKIFNYIGGNPICPDCRKTDEEDFKRIKDYLYRHPGAALSEVSTVLEVPVEKIRGFLKEGRLEILNDEGNLVLECESCGKAIKTGRFCDDCLRNVTNDLKSAASKIGGEISAGRTTQASKSVGMRYLHNENKK